MRIGYQWGLALLVLGGACEATHREFGSSEALPLEEGSLEDGGIQSAPPGLDGAPPPSEGPPDGLALARQLGAPCAADEGCDSGFCVAGRCCERACDGVCEACSETGRCDATPSDDERCETIACGLSNLCAEFEEMQLDNRCAAPGVCKTTCDGSFAAEGISCEPVAEGINGLCDGAGACIDPRASQGQACESSRDCRDLPCVDGVCCDEACDGACESCDPSGTCVADALESGCGDGRQCFGRDACLEPLGSACENAADCGSGSCEPAVGGGSACCEQPCPPGFLCNGDGVCVSPESDLGTVCTADTDCIGGRCFDGRCCDVACGGLCERCNAPGQEGRCVAAPNGSEETGCSGNLECAGRGQCRLALGSPCDLNDECRSGTCEPALQASSEICCEAVCAAGQRCGPAGNCVDAPDPDGSPCTTGADCLSGQCVGGRCCESACNGVCQACSGLGDCNVNPGNDNRCPVVDCPQTTTVCRVFPADITNDRCSSFGSCKNAQRDCQPVLAPRNTLCEQVALGVTGICDGSGNCVDPRRVDGQPCTSASECQSGVCSTMFPDRDQDGFGDRNAAPLRRCGTISTGFVSDSSDCCDMDETTNPGSTRADFTFAELTLPNTCGSFDRDCDGVVTNTGQNTIDLGARSCEDIPFSLCTGIIWSSGVAPDCGQTGSFTACATSVQGTPVTVCSSVNGGAIPNACF